MKLPTVTKIEREVIREMLGWSAAIGGGVGLTTYVSMLIGAWVTVVGVLTLALVFVLYLAFIAKVEG